MYQPSVSHRSTMSHGLRLIPWPYLCDERAHCADASDASSWWAALRQAALRIGCGRWPARSSLPGEELGRIGCDALLLAGEAGWAGVIICASFTMPNDAVAGEPFLFRSTVAVARTTGSGKGGLLRRQTFPPFAPQGGSFGAGSHLDSARVRARSGKGHSRAIHLMDGTWRCARHDDGSLTPGTWRCASPG
jgi:hypothetical protein